MANSGMSSAGLSAVIRSELMSKFGWNDETWPINDNEFTLNLFCDALGAAIVAYIQNAAYTTGADPQGGVVTGVVK